MKQRILGLAISILMTAAPAFAVQKPKSGQPKPQAAKSVVKTQPTAVKTQPTAHGKSTVKMQAKSSTAPKGKPVKVKTTTTTTAPTKGKASAKAKTSKTTTTTTTTTTTPAYSPAPGTTVTLTPVQQKLQKNTNLAAKLRTRLPAGTDLMTAAYGFKNLGQFVSAVNASYNHNVSFEGLKQRIVYENMSLGQAMKDLR